MNKNIGILGSGAVAKALGAGFLKHGYNVMLGTTNPTKLSEWKEKNPAAQIGSFEDTAKFGGIVVIAVKGHAAIDVVKTAGIANLAGKTVIDTTNPIDETKPPKGSDLSCQRMQTVVNARRHMNAATCSRGASPTLSGSRG
jgi:predicted dinucleotide-binding enzyme